MDPDQTIDAMCVILFAYIIFLALGALACYRLGRRVGRAAGRREAGRACLVCEAGPPRGGCNGSN